MIAGRLFASIELGSRHTPRRQTVFCNFFESFHAWASAYTCISLLVAVAIGSPMAYPQALGSFTITVSDNSGAIVPGAMVNLTNTATDVKSSSLSSPLGNVTISGLLPGEYSVSVSKQGFKSFLKSNVAIDVGAASSLSVELSPGLVSETVEVQSGGLEINTTNADVGTTLQPALVSALPIEVSGRMRQIDSFIFLVPGVTGSSFSKRINGGVDFQNEVLFNGVPVVSSETQGYQTNINPPLEAVNEFRVERSAMSGQYGLGQGAINYQMASGTNRLHADAFEYLRNDDLDARGYFAPVTPINKQNEFGFTVGGPVVLPRLYDGRNKTFFHVSVDWFRFRGAGINSRLTVPTAAFKNGDFSGYTDSSGKVIPIYDPATGNPFPGNIIPASRFSGASASILPLIPDPESGTGFVNNLTPQVRSLPVTQNSFDYTVDHNFTSSQAVHFTHWRDSYLSSNIGNGNASFTNELTGEYSNPTLGTGFVLTYTNTLSPTLAVTAGADWIGEINSQLPKVAGQPFTGVQENTWFPTVIWDGPYHPTNFGQDSGFAKDVNRKLGLAFNNNWLWIHGRNTFNFGGELRRSYQDQFSDQSPALVHFSNLTTSGGNTSYGNAFASFLLGQVDSVTRGNPDQTKLRNYDFSPYIQDDVKLTPKLTVNLGLRWDIMVPFTEQHNQFVFFDPDLANPAAGGLKGAVTQFGSCAICAGYSRADIHWGHFGPRIGAAYALSNKTVVQAGFGLTFLNGGAYEYGTSKVADFAGVLLQGTLVKSSNNSTVPGYGSWDPPTAIPANVPVSLSPTIGNTKNVHEFYRGAGLAPYIQTWNVGLQHQFPWQILTTATYVGNRAIHLPAGLNPVNALDPSYLSLGPILNERIDSPDAIAAGLTSPYAAFTSDYLSNSTVRQALRPYPQFQDIRNNYDLSGTTFYNALQVSAQKSLSGGLSFLVSYTVSRQLSNTDSGFEIFSGYALDKFYQRAEYSLSSADQPNAVTISTLYELPIGPGKRVLSSSNAASKALGGIQVGIIARYASGNPYGAYVASENPLFTGVNRPDVVPGVTRQFSYNNVYHKQPVLNSAAFTDVGQYRLGRAQRNISGLRGSTYSDEDINIQKTFAFGDRVRAELRLDYFNVLNRVIFSSPDSGVTDVNFGIVGGQANTPRQGQVSLRLSF